VAAHPLRALFDLESAKARHPDPGSSLQMRGHRPDEICQTPVDLLLRQFVGYPELLEDRPQGDEGRRLFCRSRPSPFCNVATQAGAFFKPDVVAIAVVHEGGEDA
jgi:hypothetical protein